MVLPIGGSLQVQNNLLEIATNGSQVTALSNLGAAALNGSINEAFTVANSTSEYQAPQTLQVQSNSFNYATLVTASSGASGAMNYTATYNPAITAYTDGMVLSFRAPITNTGASTFNAGAGAFPLYGGNGPLQGREISYTLVITCQYNISVGAWFIIGGEYSLATGPAYYSGQAPQWGQTLGGASTQTNYTSTRAFGTTYTNTLSRPLFVVIYADITTANGYAYLKVGSYTVGVIQYPTASVSLAMNGIVPPNYTYTVGSLGSTLTTWLEY